MKKFIYILSVLFITTSINAQEVVIKKNESKQETKELKKKSNASLKIGAELRPRTEYYHGYKSPVAKWLVKDNYKVPASFYTTQRSRVNMFYTADKVKFGVVLQDVRTWGSQPQLVSNDAYDTYVHQAWGEVNLTDQISLKAGRMELVYDDHRILGNVGWAPQARSHDGALFKYKGAVDAHLGIFFHGGPFTGVLSDAYKAMQYLWIHGKAAGLNYSILALNKGQAENGLWYDAGTASTFGVTEKNAYSQLLGGRFVYKTGDLSLALNAYYEMGKKAATWVDTKSLPTGVTATSLGLKDAAGKGQKISAYNVALDVMYKASANLKAGLGYEMLSGNDLTDANRTDDNSFAPLFGTNHKFNGWMDYFYVGNHGGSVGLQDINLKVLYKQGKFFAKFIPHYFMPAAKAQYTFTSTSGSTSQKDLGALGIEIDTWFGYHIVPKVASIQVGYSHMLANESMYALKNGFAYTEGFEAGVNNWAWLMFSVSPSMLLK